jgi:nicotinamide-nucleotide amidase
MKVEIITIGGELLWGETADTNAVYLGRRLIQLGLPPKWITTVGDDPESIREALIQAARRAGLVLVTGGLGTTPDDRTRGALGLALGRPLILDQDLLGDIRERLARRGRRMTSAQERLALIPKGAKILPDAPGLAPGLLLELDDSSIYCLPGVPREMETVFETQVAPVLEKLVTRRTIFRKRLRTVGISETAIVEKLHGLRLRDVAISYLPGPWSVDIWLTVRAPLAREAEDLLARADQQVQDRLQDHIYGVDDDTLERVAAALLIMKGATIAVAESCTGGLLASRLTDVPGSSACFERGVVAYSDEAKRQILKVPKSTLARHGAISGETATAMAEGIRRASGAQLGLSTTGIAGPAGATVEKPVGLTFIGLAHAETSLAEKFLFGQDRLTNKESAVQAALNMVRLHLLNR